MTSIPGVAWFAVNGAALGAGTIARGLGEQPMAVDPQQLAQLGGVAVSRVAFYSNGRIHPLVPRILAVHDEVEMVAGQVSGDLGDLVQRLIEEQRRDEGQSYKVLLLSAQESPETLQLPGPIPNNLKSKSGKPTAFTMGQRYIASERLLTAKATSDLV